MRILKGIISSLIAIILIPVIMVFIVYLSTRNMVSKQGVKDFFKEVRLSDVLIDNNGEYTSFGKSIKDELVEAGIPAETIDEFVNSEQVSDFFSDYTGDIVGYIVYDASMDDIKADDISKMINDNIDDIVEELRDKKVEGYEELTDERVNEIKGEIDNLSKEIEEQLPDIKKEVDDSDFATVVKIVRIIFSKAMVMVFIVVIAILALLIVLLNLKNYRYGIWLGVIFIISSLPFVIIGNANITIDVEASKALKDAIQFALDRIASSALIFFIAGIALIVLTIIIRIIKKHRNKKSHVEATPAQNSTPVVPMAQPAPVEQPIFTGESSTPVEQPSENSIQTNETVVPSVFGLAPGEEVKPVTEEVAEETSNQMINEVSATATNNSGEDDVCSECGAKLNAGQKFCYNCGATKK